jgi:hypothetical protein
LRLGRDESADAETARQQALNQSSLTQEINMSVIEPRKGIHNLMLARSKTGQRQFIGVFSADNQRAPNDGYWKVATTAIDSAEKFFSDGEAIDSDARLSLQGKQEKRAELAAKAIDVIKAQAKRMAAVRGMVRGQMTELSPVDKYVPGDVGAMLVDLEIARMFRESKGADREALSRQLVAGTVPALSTALLRVPPLLTGASPNLLATARNQALERRHPTELAQRMEIEAVERTTQAALNQSLKAVADATKLTPSQLRGLLGPDAEHFDPMLLSRPDIREPTVEPESPELRAALDAIPEAKPAVAAA